MNLYIRFLWLFIKRLFVGSRLGPFDVCKTEFIVNPMDLDLNFHMNNGRYLSLMDLGRVDLMHRGKFLVRLFSKGYYPVVVTEGIRFRRPLNLFQKFEMHTQIHAWDEKFMYLRQDFVRNEKIVAAGYLKACFLRRGQKETVPTKEILDLVGVQAPIPKMNEIATSLSEFEKELVPR